MVPDLALAHAAETLLEACAAAGALEWSIALALALENSLLLAGAHAALPGSRLRESVGAAARLRCWVLQCAVGRVLLSQFVSQHLWPRDSGVEFTHGGKVAVAALYRKLAVLSEYCMRSRRHSGCMAHRCRNAWLAVTCSHARLRAGLREQHPQLWHDFSELARGNERLSPYWDAIGALDQAPPPAGAASA